MQKRYAVIGLGRFGASVARVLNEMGQLVLAVDSNPDRVDALAPVINRVVRADTTDPAALKALRIGEFDTVIVAIGDHVESSVITCLNCLDCGVKHLVAKAQDDAHGRVLERIGCDRVVYPQRDMGARVANNIAAGGIIDFVRLSERYGLADLEAPDQFCDKTLQELDVRNKLGLNVVIIKRGKQMIVSPGPSERILKGDAIVVIGDAEGITRLQTA